MERVEGILFRGGSWENGSHNALYVVTSAFFLPYSMLLKSIIRKRSVKESMAPVKRYRSYTPTQLHALSLRYSYQVLLYGYLYEYT